MNDKQYRQLIWVLLGHLGGRVVVSWREIGEAPRAPVVTVQATEAGFVVSRPCKVMPRSPGAAGTPRPVSTQAQTLHRHSVDPLATGSTRENLDLELPSAG